MKSPFRVSSSSSEKETKEIRSHAWRNLVGLDNNRNEQLQSVLEFLATRMEFTS